jgi:hypothetical protein
MSFPAPSYTAEQFFALFARANQAVWPALIVWYVAAIAAIVLALRPSGLTSRLISAILAGYSIWVGVVFHWRYFGEINDRAGLFGAAFVLQGLLLLVAGVVRTDLVIGPRWNTPVIFGGIFMLYALELYPIVGMMTHHDLPAAPLFGLAPGPTVIFTVGLLLWSRPGTPKYLLVVPLVWSLSALRDTWDFGLVEDIGMLVAALVGTALIIRRDTVAPRVMALAALALAAMLVLALLQDDLLWAFGLVLLVVTGAIDVVNRRGGRMPGGISGSLSRPQGATSSARPL